MALPLLSQDPGRPGIIAVGGDAIGIVAIGVSATGIIAFGLQSRGLIGVLPAVTSQSAPDLKGWVIAGLSVGIGF